MEKLFEEVENIQADIDKIHVDVKNVKAKQNASLPNISDQSENYLATAALSFVTFHEYCRDQR